ncbi:MAG: DMT family transporter [Rhodospirillales bacterium]|nr:DMT family transporter [Rhodospirillales bacterium]
MAGLFTAVMSALVKHIGQEFSVVQILFIRQICVMLIISPVVLKNYQTVFKSNHKRIYVLRTFFSSVAMITGFTAVVYLPLAEATSISFVRTLFATLLAIIFLKEVVGVRRWVGTLIGFVGVLIVVRPDTNNFNIYALMAITSAFFVAANIIILRKVSQLDSSSTIMAYHSVLITLVMAGPALYYWKTPSFDELLLMVVAGGLMSVSQYLTIQAFKFGEAAAIAPMEYLRLLFATAIGVYYFNEIPTIWTGVGALFIVSSALYTMHRNRIRKQKIIADVPET